MVIQISCVMVHMHSGNVFHCDFSCRNLFIFQNWLIKIGDLEAPGLVIKSHLPRKKFDTSYLFAGGCGKNEIAPSESSLPWAVPFATL